ncbi:hypothetical protein HK101_001607 [Irineochytrium annulatum]|nr:hypothetical protein HK101_001607 [Irineochytrium annulatum]
MDNQHIKLLLAAVAGSVVTWSLIQLLSSSNSHSKAERHVVGNLKQKEKAGPERREIPEELIREQLARNYAFLGEDGMERLRGSFVIVVGLGGVGSHAVCIILLLIVHSLMTEAYTNEPQRLRLIDFDQVSLSSLNRHAVATQADVGTSKASCLVRHFSKIAPHATLEPYNQLFDISAAPKLLEGNPDFVLDCIDNLKTKVDLIRYCKSHNLRIVSSMGAGAKSDPSRIQIADISDTFEDPLARATRKGLRLHGVDSGVPVVYSTEKPGPVKLLPLDEAKVAEAGEYATLPNFRARVLPVLGTIPTIFGCALASYVITELAGFVTDPLPIKLRRRVYDRILKDLKMDENRVKQIGGEGEKAEVLMTAGDVGFVLEEIFKGKSLLSGSLEKEKITLAPWDPNAPIEPGNMICLTIKEAERHRNLAMENYKEVYGQETVRFAEERMEETRRAMKWRG